MNIFLLFVLALFQFSSAGYLRTKYFNILAVRNATINEQKVLIFGFESKTKNGFERIIIQKFNGTKDDSITLLYSYYGISNVEFGSNIPKNILLSNSTIHRLQERLYNGIASIYHFDLNLFEKYFSGSIVTLDLGSNFIAKTSKDSKGNIFFKFYI